jgi:hypothetical protein
VLPPVGKAGAGGAARSNSARARSLAERFFCSDLPQWKRQIPPIIAPQARWVWGAGPAAQSSAVRWQHRRLMGAENCLPASLQERALEVKLEVSGRANALGKQTPQMLDRLEQRIGPQTGRSLLLPAQHRTHPSEPLAHPMQQMVKGLQRKRRGQRLDRCFDGTTGQQAIEQPPQLWPRHRMARQYVGQEDGKAPPTAASPAPVAAPHPLAPLPLRFPVAGARIVAVELAMAV